LVLYFRHHADFHIKALINKVGPISCETQTVAVGGAHRILGEDVEGKWKMGSYQSDPDFITYNNIVICCCVTSSSR